MKNLMILVSVFMSLFAFQAFAGSSEKQALKEIKSDLLELKKSLSKKEGNALLQDFNRFKSFENQNDFEISNYDEGLFMFTAQISPEHQELMVAGFCSNGESDSICLASQELTTEQLIFQIAAAVAYQESLTQDLKARDIAALVNAAIVQASEQIQEVLDRGDQISIADMFDLQLLMNHLSQLSEMSTDVVSATNGAIMSMARGVKG